MWSRIGGIDMGMEVKNAAPALRTPQQLGITDPAKIKEVEAMQREVKQYIGDRPIKQHSTNPETNRISYQIPNGLHIVERYGPITSGEEAQLVYEVHPEGNPYSQRSKSEYPTWYSFDSGDQLGDGKFQKTTLSTPDGTIQPGQKVNRRTETIEITDDPGQR